MKFCLQGKWFLFFDLSKMTFALFTYFLCSDFLGTKKQRYDINKWMSKVPYTSLFLSCFYPVNDKKNQRNDADDNWNDKYTLFLWTYRKWKRRNSVQHLWWNIAFFFFWYPASLQVPWWNLILIIDHYLSFLYLIPFFTSGVCLGVNLSRCISITQL